MKVSIWKTSGRRAALSSVAAAIASVTFVAPIPGASTSMTLQLELAWARRGGQEMASPVALSGSVYQRVQHALGSPVLQRAAMAELTVRIGEQVISPLGSDFRVRFRLAEGVQKDRFLLQDFALLRSRSEGDTVLLRADLRPWRDRPLVLGLTRSESDAETLLLLLSCVPGSVAGP